MPTGVGDLTLLGWLVFLLYFGAAALCYRTASFYWRDHTDRRRLCWFWIAMSAILVVLGVNKQLDFQLWLNAVGRKLAESGGWYQNRGVVQVAFFVIFAAAVAVLCLLMIWMGWGHLRRLSGAYGGLAALAAFLLIRAISFDVVDLRTYIGGIKLHSLLEMAGILLIAASAVSNVEHSE